MLTAIYEEARFWFSTLAFRRRKRSMFFGFRRSVFNRVFGDFLFGIPHEQVRRSCGIFYFVFGEFFPRDLCASSFFSFSCWGEMAENHGKRCSGVFFFIPHSWVVNPKIPHRKKKIPHRNRKSARAESQKWHSPNTLMSKTSFCFRHHFLYRLVGERYCRRWCLNTL